MDKRQIILSVNIFIATFFSGCVGQNVENAHDNQTQKTDDFYTETAGWDWIRVPLIKPYEARKVNPKDQTSNWNVDFKSLLSTYNVRKLDVLDSIIYIMSGRVYRNDDTTINTIVNNRNVPIGWYVVNLKTNIEKGFADEREFNEYIKSNKYPFPKWHDVDSLSIVLANGGNLPWVTSN